MTIDIEKLIEEIDEDGSGQIEFGEFTALLQSGAPEEEGDENDWFDFKKIKRKYVQWFRNEI